MKTLKYYIKSLYIRTLTGGEVFEIFKNHLE